MQIFTVRLYPIIHNIAQYTQQSTVVHLRLGFCAQKSRDLCFSKLRTERIIMALYALACGKMSLRPNAIVIFAFEMALSRSLALSLSCTVSLELCLWLCPRCESSLVASYTRRRVDERPNNDNEQSDISSSDPWSHLRRTHLHQTRTYTRMLICVQNIYVGSCRCTFVYEARWSNEQISMGDRYQKCGVNRFKYQIN